MRIHVTPVRTTYSRAGCVRFLLLIDDHNSKLQMQLGKAIVHFRVKDINDISTESYRYYSTLIDDHVWPQMSMSAKWKLWMPNMLLTLNERKRSSVSLTRTRS